MQEFIEYQQESIFSMEAEQAVLGALMLDNESLEKVIDNLRKEHFFINKHQVIYDTIIKLNEDNDSFDPLTISEFIQQNNNNDGSEDLLYITEMFCNIPSSANIVSYSNIIVDRFMQRYTQMIGNQIAALPKQVSGKELIEMTDKLTKQLDTVFDSSSNVEDKDHSQMFTQLHKTVANIDKRFQSDSGMLGVSTGLKRLDELLNGLVKQDFIVIGARPSTGKSALGINLIESFIMNNDEVAVFFTAEMSSDLVMQRLLSSVSGVPAKSIKTGQLDENHWPLLLSAVERLKHKKTIFIDKPSPTTDFIKMTLRKIEKEHGKIGMVLVDYIQLMKAPNIINNKRLEIGECSNTLKSCAKAFDCPVIGLSQCTREVEKRPNKRPTKADLMESGSIEADADVIITMYADDVYNEDSDKKGQVELIVCKNRNGETGKAVTFFNRNIQKFENLTYGTKNDG